MHTNHLPLRIAVLAAAGAASFGCGIGEMLGGSVRPPELRRYVVYRAAEPPAIDGALGDAAWQDVPWTDAFVDIEGDARPAPTWLTRAKMLWDDDFLYVAAELEEPHLWATLTERDAVIYHDNDFEVFIDPDGDTHDYYELEINALGTVWDLMLEKPYRDGGPAVNEWDIAGLRTAVALRGTLNDPSDRDEAWTVEIALPWNVLAEYAPGQRRPRDGEQWRVNFSRVQWDLVVEGGAYAKAADSATGEPRDEHNWVWSPQGAINMHMPEMWGVVQFSDLTAEEGPVALMASEDEAVRWALRELYYAQKSYHRRHGRYARWLEELGPSRRLPDGSPVGIRLVSSETDYSASAPGRRGAVWHIRSDGREWRE
jgi:hypothetical protein